MQYNFKKHEDVHGRFETRISITGVNSFGFPAKFYADNNLKDYKYVVLFWDADNKAIGIQFSNDEQEKSKLSLVKSSKYGASLSAKSFFTKNALDSKKYKGRYDWKKVQVPDVGEVFVIELKEKQQ